MGISLAAYTPLVTAKKKTLESKLSNDLFAADIGDRWLEMCLCTEKCKYKIFP